MPRDARPLGVWAKIRASLISFVLASQCIAAIPSRSLTREQLARPEGQRTISWVASLLTIAGGTPDRDRAARLLIDASRGITGMRDAILAPLEPVMRAASMGQGWSLFSLATPVAFRIQVHAHARSGGWTSIYRANGEDPLGLAPWMTYRRIRGLYAPSANSGPRAHYDGVVTWLAQKILREHPQFDRVRVGMERITFATRTEPSASLGVEDLRERRSELR